MYMGMSLVVYGSIHEKVVLDKHTIDIILH